MVSVDPTLTISIDRTSLGLGPLVFSGRTDLNVWGILPGYQQPGLDPETRVASSRFTHGEVATGFKWRQAMHQFDAFPNVTTAAALTTAKNEVRAALGRLSYTVTVNENGQSTTWAAQPGTSVPSPIDWPELDGLYPAFSITIPCHPLPGAGGQTAALYVVAPTVPLA